jgi:polyamine oxidase
LSFDDNFWGGDDLSLQPQVVQLLTDVAGDYQWILNLDSPAFLPGSRLLQFHVVDELAARVETQPLEITTMEAMQRLRSTFGEAIPEPSAVMVTNWTNNPNTVGAYSNWPLGYTEKEWLAMTRPEAGKLFFAGEHTSSNYFGYLHGAIFTGTETANEVLQAIRQSDEDDSVTVAGIVGIAVGCVVVVVAAAVILIKKLGPNKNTESNYGK